jgi:hypothetical protein
MELHAELSEWRWRGRWRRSGSRWRGTPDDAIGADGDKQREPGVKTVSRNTEKEKETMSLMVIFYWVLLLLWAIGAVSATAWPHWPYANAFILLILFVIIGLKLLHPNW